MNEVIAEEKLEISSDIAKAAIYYDPRRELGQSLSFSSQLESIGKEWDCVLINHCKVIIMSDSAMAKHPREGEIAVTKIMDANSNFMWVPTFCLSISEEK